MSNIFNFYQKVLFEILMTINNLPRFTEFIKLPKNYKNKIFNIPKRLKAKECYEKYEYLNDFVDLEITHIKKIDLIYKYTFF
jgi:hypothetical protein